MNCLVCKINWVKQSIDTVVWQLANIAIIVYRCTHETVENPTIPNRFIRNNQITICYKIVKKFEFWGLSPNVDQSQL